MTELRKEKVCGLTGPQAVYAVARLLAHGWAQGLDEFLPHGYLLHPKVVREALERRSTTCARFFYHARDEQERREALELYEKLWADGKGKLEPFLEAPVDKMAPFWRAITDDMAMVWHPGVTLEDGVYAWAHESASGRIKARIGWLPGGSPWWGVVVVDRPRGPAFILHLSGDGRGTQVSLFKGPAPAGSRHWSWAEALAEAIGARAVAEYAREMMGVAREAELASPYAPRDEEVEG